MMQKLKGKRFLSQLLVFLLLACMVFSCAGKARGADDRPDNDIPGEGTVVPVTFAGTGTEAKPGVSPIDSCSRDTGLEPGSRLTLDRALLLTVRNNLQLKARREKVVQARAKFDQVNSHLNVKGAIEGRSQLQGPQRSLGDLSPVPLPDGIDGGLTVMWGFDATGRIKVEKILTTFGKVEHRKAAAFIGIEAARNGYMALENDVAFQVKQSFYNVLKAGEALGVARDFAQLTAEYRDQAIKLHKAGIVSRFDVLKADVAVAQARKNVISAEKRVDLSRSVLLLLMDQRRSGDFSIVSPPRVLLKKSIGLESLQARARKNRSELRELDSYVRVAEKVLDAAGANNKPDLMASGEVGMDANPMGKGVVDNYAWNVGISLRIPILDGGETAAMRKEALSNLKELKVNREALSQHIRLQVREAWLNYREARTKVEVVRTELMKSREGYFLAKARYSEGISIAVEMNEALVSYNNSRKNLVTALYDLNLAIASLERSTGKAFDSSCFTRVALEYPSVPGVDIFEKSIPEDETHEK